VFAAVLLCAVTVLIALAVFGTLRLSRTPTSFVDGVRLRIMQPNLQIVHQHLRRLTAARVVLLQCTTFERFRR
jgi:apolipoprotein N-acyltransferase